MASLRKKNNCDNWFACFTAADGRRMQRSTGTSNRTKAQKLANEYESAHRSKKTARQVQRVMSDLYRSLAGEDAPKSSVREYFKNWLDQRTPEISKSTDNFYRIKAAHFIEFLGEKADNDLNTIEKRHLSAFRDSLIKRVSASSVNHSVKFLRMVFKSARADGFIFENPAEYVRTVRNVDRVERRAFTLPELKKVLDACDDEWRTMVYLGLYTGQRLGDIARLTWARVDLQREEIRLITKKTGRNQELPIAPPLLRHLVNLKASDDPHQPVCPRAFRIHTENGHSGTLSRQFGEILMNAGLAEKQTHKTKGAGRGGKKKMREISFHALRHTATSLMKNAGISPAIVQDYIGHDSEEMNKIYTHIEMDAKRRAAAALPDIVTGAGS